MFHRGLEVAEWGKIWFNESGLQYFNHSPGVLSVERWEIGFYLVRLKHQPPLFEFEGYGVSRYPIMAAPAQPGGALLIFEATYWRDLGNEPPIDGIVIVISSVDIWELMDFPVEFAMYLPSNSDWFSV